MARTGPDINQQIGKALEDAGLITGMDSISRLVIDIRGGEQPQVYVQRDGDQRLLDIVPMLAGARVHDNSRAVRYWMFMQDALMADKNIEWPAGLRPVRADDSRPPDGERRWWLIEDDNAPADLDGKRVELTFTRGQITEGGPYEVRVERRQVV